MAKVYRVCGCNGFMVYMVSHFHGFRGFTGFMVSQVSLFHRSNCFMVIMVPWFHWFHNYFYGFNSLMVSWLGKEAVR